MNITGRIFLEAERAGIRRKSMPVFFLIREMIRSNEDCRAAISRRAIAEDFDLDDNMVYRAIKEFAKAGWLTVETKSKRYMMAKLGPAYFAAVSDTENEPVVEPAKALKKQHDSIQVELANEPAFEPTSSIAVSSLTFGVDVLRSGSKVLQREKVADAVAPAAGPPSASPPKSKPDTVPYAEFQAEFNRLCPRFRAVSKMTDDRRRRLRSEWFKLDDPSLDYWRSVFERAHKSRFLTGFEPGSDGRYYRADVMFVFRHHVEVLEGRYDHVKAPSAYAPPPPPREKSAPPEPELTQNDHDEMHRQMVRALGPRMCKSAECRVCGKIATPASAVVVTDRELEELPV